ncbi:heme exporter protein CcmD [Zoogloea sp.]|uniref:heme exporter protein CcmD n=1 Tax=Zoogloea sp. TaxID=49181 RepID=UPI0035AD9CED|nr:heme exporter protein CcmD [Rhodocyclales bacterium]
MNWASASDFFAMGGYGLYVWGSFGLTFAALAVEAALAAGRLKTARRRVRRELAADLDTQD